MDTTDPMQIDLQSEQLDITPDPRVLIALTRTPLNPIDALCELIDNGIDSFRAAQLRGSPVTHPLIQVSIPGVAEVGRGDGVLRIQDNGFGLVGDEIGNALRAGYTSKNPFDTLGLFGMGFNIATGKLGRRTTLLSGRQMDDFAMEVTLDLPEITRRGEFTVPVRKVPKPPGFDHGTVVTIHSWWPEGDPNSGFIRKLAAMTRTFVRQQIGKRYSTILRSGETNPLRIHVNEVPIQALELCAWGPDRFVERQSWGRINAQIQVDEVVATTRRCRNDGAVLPDGRLDCPDCEGTDITVINERVRGWIGVQRYDDNSEFGIDLIRNGRAIRIGEKQAFFTFVDEDTKKEVKEYPVDQTFGRIIGEIHLDQVHVDFQKQDFQRSSDEWRRAMEYLRGGSLIPSQWKENEGNLSPVSRVFQGYRKVRNYGRADMYMGYYNVSKGKADRIDRAVEREYLEKFHAREKGFYDDANWWELVENATIPPIAQLRECPDCGYQNNDDLEVCEDCGYVLVGKVCETCEEEIARSATQCRFCGASQVPDIKEPWRCLVCGQTNEEEAEVCARCSSVMGTPDPIALVSLELASQPSESLSVGGLSITLSDGTSTSPIDVCTRITEAPLRPLWGGDVVPMVSFRTTASLNVFLDTSHAMFGGLGVRPEEVVAYEAAQYLYDLHSSLAGRKDHSLATLADRILRANWEDELSESPEQVRSSVEDLFRLISEGLVGSERSRDFYGELDEAEQTTLAQGMIAAGLDLAKAQELRESGGYLRYVSPVTLVNFFRRYPESWFGGRVWSETLPNEESSDVVSQGLRSEVLTKYLRCLEDCASFLRYQRPERLIVIRARAALDFLEAVLA
jgi:hypothetical protein